MFDIISEQINFTLLIIPKCQKNNQSMNVSIPFVSVLVEYFQKLQLFFSKGTSTSVKFLIKKLFHSIF